MEKKKDVEAIEVEMKPHSKLLHGIRSGFAQMSVMLEAPHFRNACLVYTIQFCILFGYDLGVVKLSSTPPPLRFYVVLGRSLWGILSIYWKYFLIIISLNTFRLWVVQLFAIIKEYENEFTLDGDSVTATLCTMIEFKVNKTQLTIVDVAENADIVCEPVRSCFFYADRSYSIILFFVQRIWIQECFQTRWSSASFNLGFIWLQAT